MTFFSAVKKFFSKANYDFDRDDIDLYNFHPQLRIFLAINGIFFNNKQSLLRFISPFFNISLALVGTGLELMFIYHGLSLKDYAFASECFCYVMVLGTIPVVSISILNNRDTIVQLVHNMNSDFIYICKLGSKHKEIFLNGQLVTWKWCYLWMGITTFTASLYVLNTSLMLVYQCLFSAQNEQTVRPLIFPAWLPYDDPYRTPIFEIFLFIEINICFSVVLIFAAYVYTLLHYLLHYYTIMEMIILDFGVLFEGVDPAVALLDRAHPRRMHAQHQLNTRMSRIVTWHNDVFEAISLIASVYGPPLVYQTIFSSFGICIMAFQVADQLDYGKFDFLFAALCVSTVVQLWIPCYLGTLIKTKGFEVGEACWNCGWEATPLARLVRQDLVLVILRAQQPIDIKFTGLPNLTLETFSSIMSKSYTYFNMLRQST